MRVLIVNASEKTGGAAIAALRLKEALTNNGVKAKMLVRRKSDKNISVVELPQSWRLKYNFLWERFRIWAGNGFSREHLFDIDTSMCGTNITALPEYREADVIHLHWVNQGFLSLHNISRILQSGKPVVWTLHDMWPFTGICHYAHDCERFKTECHDCMLLQKPGKHDLSYRVFHAKDRILQNSDVAFVACSKWLAEEAESSFLLRGKKVADIPNPIDIQLFRPQPKDKMRNECRLPLDKQLILFSAYRTTLPIKGLDYLVDACRQYAEVHPESCDKLAIVAVGKDAQTLAERFPYPVYPMGYVEDEKRMASVYAACDAFVIPSLQDNLPNTIVEAMASGLPCIGFRVGGIPEMISHRATGYLAEPRNAEDLKKGLEWVLCECNYAEVSKAARSYAVANYSEHNVAMKYIAIYNRLCDNHEK